MREQGYMLPRSYRKIGLGFFILAILTFASLFYLIWAKVTIIVYPDTEKINQGFVFEVKEGVVIPPFSKEEVVAGKIRAVDVEGDKTFTASGSKSPESGVVGEVTITNSYSQDQTLIESTRLAIFDNPGTTLVRLRKTVSVSPGQQVEVQVYAEDPASFKDIEPMKFIIPGLWGPLQEKIYAENSETLSLTGRLVSVVTAEDLEAAESILKEQLYQEAIAQVNQEVEPQETLWPKLVSAKVEELNYDSEAGEEASEFTADIKLKAIIVVFDEDQLISLARNKLKEALPPDKQLVDLNPKSFSYVVEEYDLEAGTAQVRVAFSGSSMIASASDFLDKRKLVGLTEEEIKSYFSQFPEVKSVEVKFQPSWLKKTPRFKDKIEIEIGN
jgi:hypothetical protein